MTAYIRKIHYSKNGWYFLFVLPLYIFRELTKAMFLSLFVFTFILLSVFAGQVIKDGVGVSTLLFILPNLFPLVCPLVMPLAIVTGILICYGRMSANNEFMAVQASGVNPIWIAVPAIIMAILSVFITVTLNELALAPATRAIEKAVLADQAGILKRKLAKPGNITIQAGDEFIAMSRVNAEQDPKNRSAIDITRFALKPTTNSYWDTNYPYPTKRIVARDHSLGAMDEANNKPLAFRLSIELPMFQDLHELDINKVFIIGSESGEELIPLNANPNVSIHSNRSSYWPILMLHNSRQEAFNMMKEAEVDFKRLNSPSDEQKKIFLTEYTGFKKLYARRTAELHMKIALSFSCLGFAFFALPLAMRSKGKSASSAFAIGTFVAIVYFLMLKSLQSQVQSELLGSWSLWIPNLILLSLGILLWLRITKGN